MPVPPLPPDRLHRPCDSSALGFATTHDLPDLIGHVGQDRAEQAIRFGIGIRAEGFNLFCLGPDGTGKASMVRTLLAEAAAAQGPPPDWVYVTNFEDTYRPRALCVPTGAGPRLRQDMADLIDELRAALPAAFETETYQSRRQAIADRLKRDRDGLLEELKAMARARGMAVVHTGVGLGLAPVRDGHILSPEAIAEMPVAEQEALKADVAAQTGEMEAAMRRLPQIERTARQQFRNLDFQTTSSVVADHVGALKADYADQPAVLGHLEAVARDIIANVGVFLGDESADASTPPAVPHPPIPGAAAPIIDTRRNGDRREAALRRYRVNVVVCHAPDSGAPVEYLDRPTQPALLGRVEHVAQFGALVTDFSLIKPGALHRANGGYLVIEAGRLLMQPFAWDDLKRALRAREIRIEPPGHAASAFSTVTLEPDPIPLDVKVVLVGEPDIYHLLSEEDPEFPELFKVVADFNVRMDRTPDSVAELARLLATLVRKEGLLALDADAVARVVEQAGRLAADQQKLTCHMASLADLLREADHWARAEGAAAIARRHVQTAIEQAVIRSNRVHQEMHEAIRRGTMMIDTDGAAVGQINGLVVYTIGTYQFGKPSRITCRVRPGKGEVLDIEREVELGGPLHSKGVLILSSFLSAQFGHDVPVSLAASLVFEQSYGGVDGDSASSTELYAMLSALADLPIDQGLAVTGSVNQFGQVQAIGGVNEKIEGFYDVCAAAGLTGRQGVLIPESNAKHLMLRHDVVAAAAEGRFRIHAVRTIEEGIELLTGMPAGTRRPDGRFPTGTVYRRVENRLRAFHAAQRDPGDGRPARRAS